MGIKTYKTYNKTLGQLWNSIFRSGKTSGLKNISMIKNVYFYLLATR